jgi:hypothetical protein
VDLRITPVDACVLEGLAAFGRDVVRVADDRVSLRVGAEDVLPDIVRWLVERGTRVHAVQTRRKSLEEAFVDIMGEERPG